MSTATIGVGVLDTLNSNIRNIWSPSDDSHMMLIQTNIVTRPFHLNYREDANGPKNLHRTVSVAADLALWAAFVGLAGLHQRTATITRTRKGACHFGSAYRGLRRDRRPGTRPVHGEQLQDRAILTVPPKGRFLMNYQKLPGE